MPFTLAMIAERIGGQLRGNGDLVISNAATIGNVRPGEITFVTNERNWKKCLLSQPAAVVISGIEPDDTFPSIVVANAETAFAEVTKMFRPELKRNNVGISPQAFVSPLATIGTDVSIYPGVFIGENVVIGDRTRVMPNVSILENSRIGSDVTIFPNAVIYENTIVGDRSIIHAGAVLGAFGFGYRMQNGRHQLTAQLGFVEIGPDVEIGANATIDRGTFDATKIGEGTKIDNQVMIGHNCRVGKHNLLCSQVGIAGSSTTGEYVIMGGQVGIADHVDIADEIILGAQCGVMHSLETKQQYWGTPAISHREQMLTIALSRKLPEMRRQLAKLTQQIEKMAGQTSATDETSTDDSAHRDAA
ncbi:MAG: UDP-3-O-(3-hydroxymyristoyl)glucosamine N-acyltransferase [Pirellulaceae bacterium]